MAEVALLGLADSLIRSWAVGVGESGGGGEKSGKTYSFEGFLGWWVKMKHESVPIPFLGREVAGEVTCVGASSAISVHKYMI